MKLQKRNVPRLATIALGAVTLCLAGFALWAALTIASAVHAAKRGEILEDAYQQAGVAVAEEDFLLTEYLLRLLPEEGHLDGAKLREGRRHADDGARDNAGRRRGRGPDARE